MHLKWKEALRSTELWAWKAAVSHPQDDHSPARSMLAASVNTIWTSQSRLIKCGLNWIPSSFPIVDSSGTCLCFYGILRFENVFSTYLKNSFCEPLVRVQLRVLDPVFSQLGIFQWPWSRGVPARDMSAADSDGKSHWATEYEDKITHHSSEARGDGPVCHFIFSWRLMATNEFQDSIT